MARKKWSREEWEAESARVDAEVAQMREYVARERAKLAAKRQAKVEKPRGLRQLFGR
jgi:hypothetical protein